MVVAARWRSAAFHLMSVPGIVAVVATPGYAAVYLTVKEAQEQIFPGESFEPVELTLSEDQRRLIRNNSGVLAKQNRFKIWRAAGGGHFIVDEVIGKHEFITYAVGINSDGSVRQVEIMNYREAYGDEVRQKKWRRQFIGKTSAAPLSLNKDIKNISGATLSCRHITEGVKRILSLYEIVLKK